MNAENIISWIFHGLPWFFIFFLVLKAYISHGCLGSVKWFRPTGRKQYAWEDILEILIKDPMEIEIDIQKQPCVLDSAYDKPFLSVFILTIIMVAWSGATGYGILSALANHVKAVFGLFQDPASTTNKTGADTISSVIVWGLGFIGALYIAVAAYKGKVSSENRQKWIDEIRKNLSCAMACHFLSRTSGHICIRTRPKRG
jgi:hypothetical protein